jgi:hypothetical protein
MKDSLSDYLGKVVGIRQVKNQVVDGLCQHAYRYFSDEVIQHMKVAVENLTKFHHQGGSFVTIQEYLDRNIDSSYEMMGLKFVPRGEAETTKPSQCWTIVRLCA